jgi:uncharacterized protein YxeA
MKRLSVLIAAVAVALVLAVPAFGSHDTGGVNPTVNCSEDIAKQNANGQTGTNTGSANDEKQLDSAVTNCDHFWSEQGFGSNGP